MFRYFNLYTIALIMIYTSVSGCQEEPKSNVELKYTYYQSGKVESETQYVNGKRNGYRKLFSEDGKVISVLNFVDGLAEGMLKSYYPDGKLQASANYVHGKMVGEMYTFYPDGKIESKKIFENGKMTVNTHYTKDGKVEFEDRF